jgi:acid phosphatase
MRILFFIPITFFLALTLFARAEEGAAPVPPDAVTPASSSAKKVTLIVLENERYDAAMAQPYLAQLAKRGALLKNHHAVGHPSQPNYFALVAGDTMGITNDHMITLDKNSIVDLLEPKNKSWKVYAEDFPGECSLTMRTKQYARRQNPLISFKNVQEDPKRCAKIVNLEAFAADVSAGAVPDFSMIIPNQINNGHDSDSKQAAKWLSKFLEPLLKNSDFMKNRLVVVTFDENDYSTKDNQVYAVLLGDDVTPGATVTTRSDHYTILRTIEDRLSLGTLDRRDAKASSIQGVWKSEVH